MFRYCLYGIYEPIPNLIHYIQRFNEFSELKDYLDRIYNDNVYSYDGYIIKYELCW